MLTRYLSPDEIQDSGGGCVNRFFLVALLSQEPSLDRTPIDESQGSLSKLNLKVTGMDINSNSLTPR